MTSTLPHTIYQSSHGPCCFFQLISLHQPWTSFSQIHQLSSFSSTPWLHPSTSCQFDTQWPLFPFLCLHPSYLCPVTCPFLEDALLHLPGGLNTFPICFKAWISNVLAPFSLHCMPLYCSITCQLHWGRDSVSFHLFLHHYASPSAESKWVSREHCLNELIQNWRDPSLCNCTKLKIIHTWKHKVIQ